MLAGSGQRDIVSEERVSMKSKSVKQAEALERQAEADARTPKQQLKRLDRAGFTAKKERGKIAKKIAEQG
jgi:hypothetical protein